MLQHQPSKTIEEVVAAIEALDLEPIKFKLMNHEEGEGWTREYVDQIEIAYKRFLTLVMKYPEETIAPSKDVDKFWHGHILDTMKYAEDCRNAFGFFLHHFPYFGMRGEDDAANLAKAGETTMRLYEYEFNPADRTPAREGRNSAMCGAKHPAKDVLNTSVRPRLDTTAMCGAANPAMCGAAKPAMCGAAVKAAMCGAAKPAMCGAAANEGAAMCGATVKAAMCGAARPTMCGAAVEAAMCGAARPAMCGVAVNDGVAMCGAAKRAMCGATVEAGMCGAAKPAMYGATIGAALNTSLRPTLKWAA